MTDKRLLLGVIVMVKTSGNAVTNHIETYLDWADSEDAARGSWVTKAFATHPNARLDCIQLDDITDYAAQGFRK